MNFIEKIGLLVSILGANGLTYASIIKDDFGLLLSFVVYIIGYLMFLFGEGSK